LHFKSDIYVPFLVQYFSASIAVIHSVLWQIYCAKLLCVSLFYCSFSCLRKRSFRSFKAI